MDLIVMFLTYVFQGFCFTVGMIIAFSLVFHIVMAKLRDENKKFSLIKAILAKKFKLG